MTRKEFDMKTERDALSILAMLASLAVSALYVLRVYKETSFD